MSDTDRIGEGKVSGNQASIPAHIRRELGIEDGDTLRWRVTGDELRVSVVPSERRAFDDFDPGASQGSVETVAEHDTFGTD